MNVVRAFREGRNMEIDWNRRQHSYGYSFALLEVPSQPVRVAHGIRFAATTARENLALRIAPWLGEVE